MLSLAHYLILLSTVYTQGAAEELGFELMATSAGEEVPRTCFDAPQLPSYVRGAFFVSGPALFERGGYRFQSLGDGFGRINRFELKDGKVCYTSVWLSTGALKAANATNDLGHGMLFEETDPPRPRCPLLQPMCNAMAPNDNNFVNMLAMGDGKAVMLTDSMKMVQLDLDTLQCHGLKTWADDSEGKGGQPVQPTWVPTAHLATMGSAHPVQIPGTHRMVEILVAAPLDMGAFGMKSYLEVYTFQSNTSEQQPRQRVASVETQGAPYLHSFGVTSNHIVLPLNLQVNLLDAVSKPLIDGFLGKWKGVYVVNYEGDVQLFDTDPFYHVHIVNTFENATGVVFDLGVYDSIPFAKSPIIDINTLLNKTRRDEDTSRCVVRRLHFHLNGPLKGKTTYQDFPNPGRSVDFFKVNDKFSGRDYCIYYATEWWHDGETFANMAIFKHDLCRGTRTYWKRENAYPGEPTFIPGTSEDEDDGVVVFTAIDGEKRRSIFVTLDARNMEELSVVELPVHIPFTAHGQFVQQEHLAKPLSLFV